VNGGYWSFFEQALYPLAKAHLELRGTYGRGDSQLTVRQTSRQYLAEEFCAKPITPRILEACHSSDRFFCDR